MKTRRAFIFHVFLGLSAAVTALLASACGPKPAPDGETEASPEWPPKDE